jgi:hypothetical protein
LTLPSRQPADRLLRCEGCGLSAGCLYVVPELGESLGSPLLLPGWAAAVLAIALLRAVPPTRRWPGWAHLLLGTAATGAAVVLISGLIVGSSV